MKSTVALALAILSMIGLAALAFSLRDPPRLPAVLAQPAEEIIPREYVVLPPLGLLSHSGIPMDPIEATMAGGRWTPPKPGDFVTTANGTAAKWEAAKLGADGWLAHPALAGGYAHVMVSSESARVLLLEAMGHVRVYVNGEPRAGDPYETGYVALPVLLKPGKNEFLFQGARGRIKARLVVPRARVVLDPRDATLPDLIVGESGSVWAALVVANATREPQDRLRLICRVAGGAPQAIALPSLPPLSIRKVAFPLECSGTRAEGTAALELRLGQGEGPREVILDAAKLELHVRRPDQVHKRTFRSNIDGSVQYYAVNPMHVPQGSPAGGVKPARPALFLTLHGAGAEASGQVASYASKSWGHLVAPTNRRPFGFDWEDWGRLDALEVLALAQQQLQTDPQRTYLAGHSMGGHGVWHLGAIYPDRFAAIGPSAGWINVGSYLGAKPATPASPVDRLLHRPSLLSETVALSRNYTQLGVYILHGEADASVPVAQARAMRQHLSGFHHDLVYHEQRGAGHWWDASDEPGVDCVDWAPLFDFFARRVIPAPATVRQVDFITLSPGVSAWCHWAGIEAQVQVLLPSSVHIHFDPGQRRFQGTTENVSRLALDLAHVGPDREVLVELDGQKLPPIPWPTPARRLWLQRSGGNWSSILPPSTALKGPHRYGPFKEAFRNRVQFIYGTRGNAEENAWAFAKARFDAETFWYAGNGSMDLVADIAFLKRDETDRNVVLYGNADTNAAWKTLLADSPVQVQRGRIRVGDRTERGDDLGCLFVRPRPGSNQALVGVVAGTGMVGMRGTDRVRYFNSGVALPDCVILGPGGPKGVRAAGFFGADWSVSAGEFAWRQ